MPEQFIELFPLETEAITELSAYHLQLAADAATLGARLAYRLSLAFEGDWAWVGDRLVTNQPVSPVQIEITLDLLRQQFPEFAAVQGIREDVAWAQTPSARAEYALFTQVRAAEAALHHALAAHTARLPNARVDREALLRAWVVQDEPALSISIRSHLVTERSLQAWLNEISPADLLNLPVLDRASPSMVGTLEQIHGTLATERERLLTLTKRPATQEYLRRAPDDEAVVRVRRGEASYDYAAGMLDIVLRLSDAELCARFGVSSAQAARLMRLAPADRARLVRAASDALKERGLLRNAYNSRTHPDYFSTVDFVPNLVFAERRVLPYRPRTLAQEFLKGGVYRVHPRFQTQPIKLGVINTLDETVEDFMEAMRRQMERDFGLHVEVIKERRVRVVTSRNLESAVRVVEKESPHLILAFFKDAPDDEEDGEARYNDLKTYAMPRGIAAHAVYERSMHDVESMPAILMGILARTGSIPFALAEPLEYADMVVGLQVIRETLTRGDRVTALARIYQSDGVFLRYILEQVELELGEKMPFIVLQSLFPSETFTKKRIILHHDGLFDAETLELLARWAKVLKAEFYPVEILRDDVPRLYTLDRQIVQPAWGSVFWCSGQEAFVVSSTPGKDSTPRPLRVRVPVGELGVDQAVYSVLAWTLLHYGTLGTPRLPVTIYHAAEMAQWLARGILPEARQGDVPFWL